MKNKLLRLILILILFVIVAFCINRLVIAVSGNSLEEGEIAVKNLGTIAEGETNPQDYEWKVNKGHFQVATNGWHAGYKGSAPDVPGYQVFCIQRGTHITYQGLDETVWKAIPTSIIRVGDERYSRDMITISEISRNPYYHGSEVRTIYEPGEEGKLSTTLAYAISDINSPWRQKQLVVWDAGGNLEDYGDEIIDTYKEIVDDDGNPVEQEIPEDEIYNDEQPGERERLNRRYNLDEVSSDYKSYDLSVRAKGGLDPTDNTDYSPNKFKIEINGVNETYEIGPFNIRYMVGSEGNYVFSGISDMVAIGYNSKNEVITGKDNIEVIGFREKEGGAYGDIKELKCFEPNSNKTALKSDQSYPKSGKDFIIIIKNPNKDETNINEIVSSVSLKVKFKYMLAEGKYQKYNGTAYQVYFERVKSGIYYDEIIEHGRVVSRIKRYRRHTATYDKNAYMRTEQNIIMADAIRTIYEQEILLGLEANKTTTYEVTKIWLDNGNNDTNKTVQVQLYDNNGNPVEGPKTLTKNKPWYLWENLDENKTYKAKEITEIPGYITTYQYTSNSTIIVNKANFSTFTVHKYWDDENEKYKSHPNHIWVRLYDSSNKPYGNKIKLDDNNNWTYTWENLKSTGYYVRELDGEGNTIMQDGKITSSGYKVKYTNLAENITRITNTYTSCDFTIYKIWQEDSYISQFTFQQMLDEHYGNYSSTGKDTLFVQWLATHHAYNEFEGYDDWRGMTLYDEDGTTEIGRTNKQVKTFKNVQDKKYILRENGEVEHTDIEGNKYYTLNISGKNYDVFHYYDYDAHVAVIINCYNSSPMNWAVLKEWVGVKDEDIPDSIDVRLMCETSDGRRIYLHRATLNSKNSWSYQWSETAAKKFLADRDANLNIDDVRVYIEEVENSITSKYRTEYSYIGNLTIITNIAQKEFYVKKIWDDAGGKVSRNPITVQLIDKSNNEVKQTQELNSSNNWSYTFTELNSKIDYTVKEVGMGGYEVEYIPDVVIKDINGIKYRETIGMHIINSGTTEDSHTVIKQWYDNDDESGNRPISITVQLGIEDSNGNFTPATTVNGYQQELNEDKKWTYTWTNLKILGNGYRYKVIEIVEKTVYKNASPSIYQRNYGYGKPSYEYKTGTTIIKNQKTIPILIDISGHVWEDVVSTKESIADGVSNTGGGVDKSLKNIKVTLYESNGKLAKILSDPKDNTGNVMNRINPTLTDEDGNYLFEGLDPLKQYYVTFEYNGQVYMPTEYNKGNAQYITKNSGDAWKYTSKATEKTNERNNFNSKFEEIGSYPANYKTTNSLGVGIKINGTYYNSSYSQLELMGYTLSKDGIYSQTGVQLIDGYKYDNKGLQTNEWSQGVISTKIREKIQSNKAYPDIKQIYNEIAGSNQELKKMLQFIEDCKINAYTKSQDGGTDLYPIYQNYIINKGSVEYNTGKEAQNATYNMSTETRSGTTYNPIYPGQFFINLGLWRRQEADISLTKDLYRSVVKINNKTEIYKEDPTKESKRKITKDGTNKSDGNDNETCWDIPIRMSDGYYDVEYNRKIYKSDYNYIGEKSLDLYVTYKITAKNQSQSTVVQINEIVDLYSKDYEYMGDLSWITYNESNLIDNVYEETMLKDNIDGANMVNTLTSMKTANATNVGLKNLNMIKLVTNANSKYGAATHSDIYGNGKNYQAIYIQNIDKKLSTGSKAYIYLTFKVKKDSSGKIILGKKENLAEINGFTTYYANNTPLPNYGKKSQGAINNGIEDPEKYEKAGLLDRDSNPGNLYAKDLTKSNNEDKYQRNFEDDTDEAPPINPTPTSEERVISGIVWEDDRNQIVEGAIIGNGIYKKDNNDEDKLIAGIHVSLWEYKQKEDGTKELVRAKMYDKATNKVTNDNTKLNTATTDANGKYSFEGYIPGDYVVRFEYGEPGEKYNAQDYKSTIYQAGINQPEYTDLAKKYKGYKDLENQNASCSYGYSIEESQKVKASDAKDIWKTRESVINVCNGGTKDSIGDGVTYEIANALYNKTYSYNTMTAETGVISGEIEFNRQISLEGEENGNYLIGNVDFGLVERPKAQLLLDKSIENIKVTLANGTVLFDINGKADNAIWMSGEACDVKTKKVEREGKTAYLVTDIIMKNNPGLVLLTMDEELMHGATVQITYKITVKNNGEIDYKDKKFYYLGIEENPTANIVKTKPCQIIDYVNNNLKFDKSKNNNWNIVNKTTLTGLLQPGLSEKADKFNTIIENSNLEKELAPGETLSEPLVLSQLITSQNTSDNLVYSNMVEIVKVSNTVGRKMEFSIVGNQDPEADKPSEVDSDMAEQVKIVPPYGDNKVTYYIIGTVIAVILLGGIIFIKRKVIRK